MYVFLLAGSEVVLSSVVLATCNFLFIKRKPQEPSQKLECITVTDDTNTEVCSRPSEVNDEEEKGEREEQEKETKREASKELKEEEEKDKEKVDEVRPKSVTLDSQEVEKFLKEPQLNGGMTPSPETCL